MRNTVGVVGGFVVACEVALEENRVNAKEVTMIMQVAHVCSHTFQGWVKDPDGSGIELMAYTAQSFRLGGRS